MRKIIIAGSATFYKEALEIKNELENKGYYVYVGNARYTYKNANQNVQPNELLVAFKNE